MGFGTRTQRQEPEGCIMMMGCAKIVLQNAVSWVFPHQTLSINNLHSYQCQAARQPSGILRICKGGTALQHPVGGDVYHHV